MSGISTRPDLIGSESMSGISTRPDLIRSESMSGISTIDQALLKVRV